MRRLRSLLGGLLLAGFGMALAFAVAEVGIRALRLVPTRFWEPDPLLGTRLIAGKEGWWTQEEIEFRVSVRINSAGLRDVEHSLVKPPGVFRIVVLGDSFIEAMQVPLEDTFGRQLERNLNRLSGDARYEVISLGVSGYGTASELLAYREIGRLYGPDLILLAFYPGNDVRNNSPGLETQLRPVYAADGSLQRVSAAVGERKGRGSWLGRLLAASQAYRFFRKMILTQHPKLAARLIDAGLVGAGALHDVPEHKGVPLDYWIYAPAASEEWQDAWRRTESLLLDLRRMVAAEGKKLVLLVVPGREQIDPSSWEEIVAARPAMQAINWDLYAPERRLLRWCEKRGITCLRLTDAFLGSREAGAPLHYRFDGHWTAAGHRLAAETVMRFLRDSDMLAR